MGLRSLSLAALVILAMPLASGLPGLYGEPVLDPLESPQWSLALVNATGAWALLPGHHDVVVATIDTGADLAHPDLQGSFWEGNALHGAFVGQPYGWGNHIPPQARTTQDDEGHGTLVAGVIGARGGNLVGIRGVADVPVMLVKFVGLAAPGNADALADGIVWAVDHGARVLSISQVVSASSPALEAAVAHAEASGVVIVAASGNNGGPRVFYPAGYPTVVSVGAVDADGLVWASSTYGKVDIAAPGVDVVTTALPARYALVSGTSLAAPHVAAAAALILAADPALAPAQVRAILASSAAPTGDARAGAGILDVGKAVSEALP